MAVFIASSGNKVRVGTASQDFFGTTTDSVSLSGLGGDDYIDIRVGGSGANTLEGGDGNDTVLAAGGNDSITGGAGNDQLSGLGGNDTLAGGLGFNFLVGGLGDDLFISGGGTDNIQGGDGVDTLSFAGVSGPVTVDAISATGPGLAGTTYFSGVETIIGTSAGDSIGYVGSLLDGGGGDDTLIGVFASASTLLGGEGNDQLIGGGAGDSISGGTGDDYIFGYGGADTVDGGAGNDVILGSGANSSLSGGLGDDVVVGSEGADTIDGGAGANYIVAGSGDDLILSTGTDTVLGGDGIDTLSFAGLTAGVVVNAYSATSSAIAGATYFGGIEALVGTAFGDTFTLTTGVIDGGAGFDTLDLGFFQIGFSIDLSAPDSPALDLRLTSIEGLRTGYGADVLTGDAASNLLDGGNNGDALDGGAGNDTIIGGEGDDVLTGGAGSDIFKFAAGSGADIITDLEVGLDKLSFAYGSVTAADFSLAGGELSFSTAGASITFLSDATGFSFAKDVMFYGTDLDETFTLSEGIIDGGGGFDTLDLSLSSAGVSIDLSVPDSPALDLRLTSIEGIKTGNGADVLVGNDVANLLDGGDGGDELDGGAGNDTIVGGAGDDALTGGAGADVFLFGAAAGDDIIVDFEVGTDKLSFATGSVTAADFTLVGGDLSFTTAGASITFIADATGFSFANDVIFY